MSAWRPYDSQLMPAFYERFERWGKGTAPFLDPETIPRAQWINTDTGVMVAVVPIWTVGPQHRSFGVFCLPPAGDIWGLRPGYTNYLETGPKNTEQATLRNDAFRKAVAHAKEFIYGTQP